MIHHLVEVEADELTTDEAIVQATHEFVPLIAQTEIWNEKTGLVAVMEYPIKTMNTVLPGDMQRFNKDFAPKHLFKAMDTIGRECVWQVDTGPVAFPDLEMACENHAERISLVYIAFNLPDIVDFVVIQPTPIEKEGKEVTTVHYYSRYVHLPARNRIFAIQEN